MFVTNNKFTLWLFVAFSVGKTKKRTAAEAFEEEAASDAFVWLYDYLRQCETENGILDLSKWIVCAPMFIFSETIIVAVNKFDKNGSMNSKEKNEMASRIMTRVLENFKHDRRKKTKMSNDKTNDGKD